MKTDVTPQPNTLKDESVEDAELVRILDVCIAEMEAGRALDTERLYAEHPALADRLKTCLAGIQVLQQQAPALHLAARGGAAAGATLGDYRIVREIGRGGMGVVYEAEQISLRRRVALKTLPSAAHGDPRLLQRFLHEAQAAAQLHHGNIVPIYAIGSEGGVHFFAMQYIEGRSLDQVLRNLRAGATSLLAAATPHGAASESTAADRTPRSTDPEQADPTAPAAPSADPEHFREVARFGMQVAAALEYAHQVGIVHRDVKPANLLLDGDNHLWVADFGLAQVRGDSGLTRSGEIVGTLRYMSPEQAAGPRASVDHRTDVYALGATLYELLTLRPIFTGAEAHQLLHQIRHEEPAPPRRLNPGMPGDLEIIVLKAVAKERDERYQRAQELADDLQRFLDNRPILARAPTLVQRTQKWVRRHRPLVAVGGVSSVAVLIMAVIALVFNNIATAERAQRTADVFKAEQVALKADNETIAEREKRVREVLQSEQAGRKIEIEGRNKLLAILERERITTYFHRIRLAELAVQDNQLAKADEYLDACLPEPEQRDLRRWEWYYLKRLCNAALFTLDRRGDFVRSIALSPDGQRVACLRRSVQVVDVDSGKPAFTTGVTESGKGFWRAAFSPDGTLLAAGSPSNVLKIWSAGDGQELLTLKGCQLAFNADGKTLITVDDPPATVRMYDASTGMETRSWACPKNAETVDRCGWAFSRDGLWVAIPTRTSVIILASANTGDTKFVLQKHTGPITDVAFSPDGRLLASVGFDGQLKLWDTQKGVEILAIRGPGLQRSSLVFSPDGKRLIQGTDDGAIKIFDTKGQELQTLRGHRAAVVSMAFSSDGSRLATNSNDATIKIWNGNGEPKVFLAGKTQPAGYDPALAFRPDNRQVASAAPGHAIKVWEPNTGEITLELPGDMDVVQNLMYRADGARLYAHAGQQLKMWDTMNDAGWHTIAGPQPRIWSAAVSPRGAYLACADGDERITIRDAKSNVVLFQWRSPQNLCNSLTFSPDERRLVGAGSDRVLRVWEVATQKELFACPGHSSHIVRVEFSPDGKFFASADASGNVRLWHGDTGKAAQVWSSRKPADRKAYFFHPIAFSADSQRLAMTGISQSIILVDVNSGLEVLTLYGHRAGVSNLAFSSDARLLVSTGFDGTSIVWNATALDPQPQNAKAK